MTISRKEVDDAVASLEALLRGKAHARQEILDVLLRYCRAFDRLDWDLLSSAYHPGAVDNRSGFHAGSAQEFIASVPERIGEMVQTSHLIFNVLVKFDSPTRAGVESYSQALMRFFDEGKVLVDRCVQLRYIDRFERRAGQWRITKRVAVYDSARTDPVNEKYTTEFPAHWVSGVRGRSDPSYGVLG